MESQLQIYSGVSIAGYVLTAVFLVASVAIFFLMDIKGVYAYLSGKKQQKGIMEMREKQQEDTGKGSLVPNSVKLGFTPPPKPTSKKINKQTVNNKSSVTMQSAKEENASETVNLKQHQSETIDKETDVLNKVDFDSQNALNNMSEDYPTDVLNSVNANVGTFVLIKNIMEVHTSEVL